MYIIPLASYCTSFTDSGYCHFDPKSVSNSPASPVDMLTGNFHVPVALSYTAVVQFVDIVHQRTAAG